MAAPDMKGILLFFEMVITFFWRSGMGEGALDVVLPIPIVFIRPASTIFPANGIWCAVADRSVQLDGTAVEDKTMNEILSLEKSCTYDGSERSHGSELCTSTKCLRCEDGEWVTSVMIDRERDFMDWL